MQRDVLEGEVGRLHTEQRTPAVVQVRRARQTALDALIVGVRHRRYVEAVVVGVLDHGRIAVLAAQGNERLRRRHVVDFVIGARSHVDDHRLRIADRHEIDRALDAAEVAGPVGGDADLRGARRGWRRPGREAPGTGVLDAGKSLAIDEHTRIDRDEIGLTVIERAMQVDRRGRPSHDDGVVVEEMERAVVRDGLAARDSRRDLHPKRDARDADRIRIADG